MPKLYSLMQIIRQTKDGEETVPKNRVFDGTVAEAKQFDGIKAARPATKAEVEAAEKAQAVLDGLAAGESVTAAQAAAASAVAPASGAKNDPNG